MVHWTATPLSMLSKHPSVFDTGPMNNSEDPDQGSNKVINLACVRLLRDGIGVGLAMGLTKWRWWQCRRSEQLNGDVASNVTDQFGLFLDISCGASLLRVNWRRREVESGEKCGTGALVGHTGASKVVSF
jgi:hypothetical protein